LPNPGKYSILDPLGKAALSPITQVAHFDGEKTEFVQAKSYHHEAHEAHEGSRKKGFDFLCVLRGLRGGKSLILRKYQTFL